MIFSDNSVLSVKNTGRFGVSVYLTLDGQINVKIPDGGSVRIAKADVKSKFIRFKDHGFYKRLSNKLN